MPINFVFHKYVKINEKFILFVQICIHIQIVVQNIQHCFYLRMRIWSSLVTNLNHMTPSSSTSMRMQSGGIITTVAPTHENQILKMNFTFIVVYILRTKRSIRRKDCGKGNNYDSYWAGLMSSVWRHFPICLNQRLNTWYRVMSNSVAVSRIKPNWPQRS